MRNAITILCLLGLLAACSDAKAPDPAPTTEPPQAAPTNPGPTDPAPGAPSDDAVAEAERLQERGLKAIRNGNFEKGFGFLDDALELTPTSGRLRFSRGLGYAIVGRIPDARVELDKAVELEPDDPEIRLERARVYAQLGNVDQTLEDLRHAEKLDAEGYPLDIRLWREAVRNERNSDTTPEPKLDLIKAELAALRGLPFKREVPSEHQSAEAFGEMVQKSLDEELGGDGAADLEDGLARLGLLEESVDLKRDVTNALKSQAAAYYDPEAEKFFFLVEGLKPEFLESIGAHELVHALQDQHFDLDAFLKRAERKEGEVRNDDRVFALRCLVEGEAMFVQMAWQMQQMGGGKPEAALAMATNAVRMVANMRPEQLNAMLRSLTAALPDDDPLKQAAAAAEEIPPYIVVPLMAAYMDGAGFTARVYQEGGWDAVADLYENPPTTAEQCLHATKFANGRDEPTPVSFPAMPEIAAAGFGEVDAAVHGEIYLRILLTGHGTPEEQALKAAAGWDGDLYRAYRDDGGRVAIVLATTWDSEEEAREFYGAYKTALAGKYAGLTPEDSGSEEAFVYTCGGDLGAGSLRLRGREVFSVEGFSREVCAKLIERLAQHEIAHVD